MADICPTCDRRHAPDWAYAVGRFTPHILGYRAVYPDSPLRPTRAEAEGDMCRRMAEGGWPSEDAYLATARSIAEHQQRHARGLDGERITWDHLTETDKRAAMVHARLAVDAAASELRPTPQPTGVLPGQEPLI